MTRLLFGFGLALAFIAPACADDEEKTTLAIGSTAPKLALKEFIKGEPVKGFEKDNIYVLEFWATWCGPCVKAIPHVTALQKKNEKVVFIGVNVWEEDLDKVKPFVEKMGDKMAYRVATDEGGESGKGTMAKTWLAAAGQDGIPCTMIVNGDGKIAWIGHPMQLDKPLAKIVAGKWDLAAAVAEAKKEKELEGKMQAAALKIRRAMAKGPVEALKAIDEILDLTPELEKQLAMGKFDLLDKVQKLDGQVAYGERLVDKVFAAEPEQLNELAWMLVDPDRPAPADPKLRKLALKAALKADAGMESKDPAIADTLARAYFVTGDKANALKTQERAVSLAKGTEMEEELKVRLEEYKKAGK